MLKLQRWEDAENAFRRVLQAEPAHQQARDLLEVARRMRTLTATLAQSGTAAAAAEQRGCVQLTPHTLRVGGQQPEP